MPNINGGPQDNPRWKDKARNDVYGMWANRTDIGYSQEAEAENKWFAFLTARAEAIAQLVKEGKSPEFIAGMMNLTPDLVKGIFDNHMGVRNNCPHDNWKPNRDV